MKKLILSSLLMPFFLVVLVNCGGSDNDSSSEGTTTTQKTVSLESLQKKGIYVVEANSNLTYGSTLEIVCKTKDGVINQDRRNELISFAASLKEEGTGNMISQTFTAGNTVLYGSEMYSLLERAVTTLEKGNLYSSTCPEEVLAQSY